MTLPVLALALFNSHADLSCTLNASFYLYREFYFFNFRRHCEYRMWTIYSVFIPAVETEQQAGSQVSQL